MIQFKCKNCGEPMESPDSLCGQMERCDVCGAETAVPDGNRREVPVHREAGSTAGHKLSEGYIEVKGKIVHETDRAYLFMDTQTDETFWFPQSCTDATPTGLRLPKKFWDTRFENAKESEAISYRRWFDAMRHAAEGAIGAAATWGGIIAGFRIKIGHVCVGAMQYHKAFLPIEVAIAHPELLPPYGEICKPDTCECKYRELRENSRLKRGTPVIMGPGDVRPL